MLSTISFSYESSTTGFSLSVFLLKVQFKESMFMIFSYCKDFLLFLLLLRRDQLALGDTRLV